MAAGGLDRPGPPTREFIVTASLLAITMQGASKIVPPVAGVLWVMFPFYVLGGLSHGVKNTLIRALIQQRAPTHELGHASAAYNALRNGAEIGALLTAGALITLIGARETLFLAGLGCAPAGVIALVWRTRLRSEEVATDAAAA